jgi:PAS domain S-box-containing protein
MDERQHCAYMNRAAEELTGYSFAETQGPPLHDVIHHTIPTGRHFPLEELRHRPRLPENADTRGEEVFVHKDGSFYPVAFVASPIRDEAVRTIGTIIEVRISRGEGRAARAGGSAGVAETLNRTGGCSRGARPEKVVQQVTDAGVELTGAAFGAFFYNVVTDTGERLHVYTLSGADASSLRAVGMPRATAIFDPTFAGEGVVRSEDILLDPRYGKNAPHKGHAGGPPAGALLLGSASYLRARARSLGGSPVRAIPEPGRFAERHEQVLVGLAAQAAIAIDNARLFQAVQRANETLEARVAERTEELVRTQEALQQSHKMEAVGPAHGGIATTSTTLLAGISAVSSSWARAEPRAVCRMLSAT